MKECVPIPGKGCKLSSVLNPQGYLHNKSVDLHLHLYLAYYENKWICFDYKFGQILTVILYQMNPQENY